MIVHETRLNDVVVEFVDEDGHHYADGKGGWHTEPLSDDEQLDVAAARAEAERVPEPSADERIANLEAALLAVTKTASVKDDPELAKAAEQVAAIEATRTRLDPVAELPVDEPVKGGQVKGG